MTQAHYAVTQEIEDMRQEINSRFERVESTLQETRSGIDRLESNFQELVQVMSALKP